MTVAWLCDEIKARKHIAPETKTWLETHDKIIAKLQAKADEGKCKLAKAESRIHVSKELVVKLRMRMMLQMDTHSSSLVQLNELN